MHFTRIVGFFLYASLLLPSAAIQGQNAVPSDPMDISRPWERGSESHEAGEFRLAQAPESGSLVLRKGDRLAIIGDSITEQKMYSRIIETYLTVCVPELEITARQFGWSGETAEGFGRRMESDCLRFEPTVATLCYGMNDHRYRTYDPENGQWYRNNYASVVERLQDAGARVVLGSPGCVGKVPHWTNSEAYSLEQLNANLATLRNISLGIAREKETRFADIFWTMLQAGGEAQERFGDGYAVPGKDGVHPGWSGQLIMAYTFLKAMGLDGDIASIHMDLDKRTATVSRGHEILGLDDQSHQLRLRSHRYPFCASGPEDDDNSIRSGMSLVPFNRDLNRFELRVTGAKPGRYRVWWGDKNLTVTAAQLTEGINLAGLFEVNPFSEAFAAVDQAVGAKQSYETRQIKQMFHSPEFRADPDAVVRITEKVREPLARAIADSFKPVEHTIRIESL